MTYFRLDFPTVWVVLAGCCIYPSTVSNYLIVTIQRVQIDVAPDQDYSLRLGTNSPLKGLDVTRAETFSENQLYLLSLTLGLAEYRGRGNAY
jgi:hypothetical protein